jgi:hypothetical protein
MAFHKDDVLFNLFLSKAEDLLYKNGDLDQAAE